MAFTKYVYKPKTEIWGREIEYIINRDQFDAIIGTRDNKNVNSYMYVMDYINETFGLLGTVTALSVEGDFFPRGQRAKVDIIEE